MSENDNFNELKQLLKLKQHEVPPPGYFNNFSDTVRSRIRAGEVGEQRLLERFEGSLVMRLLHVFQGKPTVIGGFATSLCLLLLVGVVMADRNDNGTFPGDLGQSSVNEDKIASTRGLLPASDSSGITVTTNVMRSFQPAQSLFGSQPSPLFLQNVDDQGGSPKATPLLYVPGH
jgi:hypothetical protein